ncbi:MAG: hypothetical protein GX626_08535 [Spirochaetales bacterium]|jgi:hypothetical protein|nr:hypothetical protein [Spirochaetales bacterium]
MKRFVLVLLILSLALGSLSARPNSIAVGAQLGFAASGAVVDVGLGSLYLNAGIGYPLGLSYIGFAGGEDDVFIDVATLTADVSQAFALSENFDIKVGIGATAFTELQSAIFGLAGPVFKGEYWIPNKNYGLTLTLNVPVMAFGYIEDDEIFTGGVAFNAFLPLIGLVTSTIGVLYSF